MAVFSKIAKCINVCNCDFNDNDNNDDNFDAELVIEYITNKLRLGVFNYIFLEEYLNLFSLDKIEKLTTYFGYSGIVYKKESILICIIHLVRKAYVFSKIPAYIYEEWYNILEKFNKYNVYPYTVSLENYNKIQSWNNILCKVRAYSKTPPLIYRLPPSFEKMSGEAFEKNIKLLSRQVDFLIHRKQKENEKQSLLENTRQVFTETSPIDECERRCKIKNWNIFQDCDYEDFIEYINI